MTPTIGKQVFTLDVYHFRELKRIASTTYVNTDFEWSTCTILSLACFVVAYWLFLLTPHSFNSSVYPILIFFPQVGNVRFTIRDPLYCTLRARAMNNCPTEKYNNNNRPVAVPTRSKARLLLPTASTMRGRRTQVLASRQDT